MRYSDKIGRIGALAVALGVGTAVGSMPAVAWADTSGSGTSGAGGVSSSGPSSAGSGGSRADAQPTGSHDTTGTTTAGSTETSSAGTDSEPATKPDVDASDDPDSNAGPTAAAPKSAGKTSRTHRAIADAADDADAESDAKDAGAKDAETAGAAESKDSKSTADTDISAPEPPARAAVADTAVATSVEVTAPQPITPDPVVPVFTAVVTTTELTTPTPPWLLPTLPGMPLESPTSWVLAAVARRELGGSNTGSNQLVNAAGAVASTEVPTGPPIIDDPTIGTPDPTTGAVTGAIVASGGGGGPLTYTVKSSPSTGTLNVNPGTGKFTYTPTAVQRVLAGLNSTTDIAEFTVTVSDGTTQVDTLVTVPVAPTALNKLGQIKTGIAPFGVVANNTRAYIVNAGDGTVSVIDTTNRILIAIINVGGIPVSATLTPDGKKLYVTNGYANKVSVIDTAAKVVTRTITVGAGAFGVTVNPAGTTIYVANSASGTVSKISTKTDSVIGTVTGVGIGSAVITISSDGKTIYTANFETGAVSYFSATASTAKTIAVGAQHPSGLALSKDNTRLYVASNDGTIKIVNTTTNTLAGSFTVGDVPVSLAVSKDGSLLLVGKAGGKITALDITTGAVVTEIATTAIGSGVSTSPIMALSPDGMQLYLTDDANQLLRVVSLVPADNAPVSLTPTINAPSGSGVVTGKLNGYDSDGDALTYSTGTSPSKGTLKVNADGTFTYTASATARHTAAITGATAAQKTDTFTVLIDDGRRGITTATVTVNIPKANTDPTAQPTSGTPSTATGIVKGSVKGADRDYDALTYTARTSGAKGTVTIDTWGNYIYTPTTAARHAASRVGATLTEKTDTVTVTVNDGHGGVVTKEITVALSPKNTAPTAAGYGPPSAGATNGSVAGGVNAFDADGDAFAYAVTKNPKKGTVVINANGTYVYLPSVAAQQAANKPGANSSVRSDSFIIAISDGHGGTVKTTVKVVIAPQAV